MAIKVHNGGEGCNYNSYASLAAANTYHADRATPSWASADEASRTAALIRATDYIDANYRFTGDLSLMIRAKAAIVLAAHAVTDTLAGRVERDVVELEQKLEGVGSKRTKYAEGEVSDPYPNVTSILASITAQKGGGVSVGWIVK